METTVQIRRCHSHCSTISPFGSSVHHHALSVSFSASLLSSISLYTPSVVTSVFGSVKSFPFYVQCILHQCRLFSFPHLLWYTRTLRFCVCLIFPLKIAQWGISWCLWAWILFFNHFSLWESTKISPLMAVVWFSFFSPFYARVRSRYFPGYWTYFNKHQIWSLKSFPPSYFHFL